MDRVRVSLGLILVAAASAWAGGGADALRALGQSLLAAAPWLLIAAGAVAALSSIASPRILALPTALIVAGISWQGARRGWFGGSFWESFWPAAAIVIGGALVMLRSQRQMGRDDRAVRAFVFPASYVSREPAARITVLSVGTFGPLTVDLSTAQFPFSSEMHIFVRVLYGRVCLVLPKSWTVVAGELASSYRIALMGDFDSTMLADEILPDETGEPISQTVKVPWHRRLRLTGRSKEPAAMERRKLLIIHIAGFGGTVALERR